MMNLHALMSITHTAFSLLLCIFAIMQPLKAANVRVSSVEHGGNNETDHTALLAIKSRLTDSNGGRVLSSWNHSLHHYCSWEGVTCGGPERNRVIMLNLMGRGLGGTISPLIGNLSLLRSIRLSNNHLTGQIPPEVGLLSSLGSLDITNNSLSGEIPNNISGCINLLDLSLAVNNLQGKLPTGLRALSNLKYLRVYSNKLSGPLFRVIANLTSLEVIHAGFNAFTGTIPDNIVSRMRNLIRLDLESSKLSGMIPPSIFNISSLEHLELGSNQLRGSIPPNLAITLPQLRTLGVDENYLSGPFPISIQNLTSLEDIGLSYNNFMGSISSHFGQLNNLLWLTLDGNNFVGDIEIVISTIVNCSRLMSIGLSKNKFTGRLSNIVANLSSTITGLWLGGNPVSGGIIPIGISNMKNLMTLDLSDSKLTGTIPHQLGKLQRLENLILYTNKLTGEIPSSLSNSSLLSKLYLFENHLQGIIPPSLGNCENLLYLFLDTNHFQGTLPKELFGGYAKFIRLDVSHNQFSGSLPHEISEQFKLVEFNVSANYLSGEIPPLMGRLFSLQNLYMRDNFFNGSIPSTFSSLKSLMEIDFSQNNISGPLPEYFSSFPLIYLNLSYNNFEGMVPTNGVFANASTVFLEGNNRLCGGVSELRLPTCLKKIRFSHASKSKILIICAIFGVLVMVTCIWLYIKYHGKNQKHLTKSRPIIKEPAFFKVSYDMLFKATDGFSPENLLGSGTFGSVYKGIINGNTIAVKVLNLQHRGGTRSFMAECEALRNVRHRNLVRIITVCSSIDFKRYDFKALVYEFMPNGTLDRWLHEGGNLSLVQRLEIAIDVAYALNHLHHECDNTIVHCDLKPSNILLDNQLVAHVADFGIAKVLNQPQHPNQSSSIGVRGTFGYVAPEYGLGSEASPETDLYSYGILLLELMTSKRPTDNLFQEDLNLHTYAMAALPDQVLQIVDAKLITEDGDDEYEEDDTMCPRTPERLERREKCIKIVVETGVACSDRLPHNRMKICTAIRELQHARNMILNPRKRRNLASGKRG